MTIPHRTPERRPALFEPLEVRILLSAGPQNLESHLLALLPAAASLPGPAPAALDAASPAGGPLVFDATGAVLVDVWARVEPGRLAPALADVGFEPTGASEAHRLLEGLLPVESLCAAAALPGVLSITPVYRAAARAGSATTEGDAVHNADDVRALDPAYDGRGVKVGVLSDSALLLADSQATGDLPAYVERLMDFPASDEGRALLEIVHDLAPGAELSFRSVILGEADYAQGIRDLAAAGARVIVDDVVLPSEPFFQDGIVAQAVAEVAASHDVLYVAAAGNESDLSYEAAFTDDGAGSHDFDAGAGVDSFQAIAVPDAGEGYHYPMTLSLQWDQPFYTADGVVSDFDVLVYDAAGTTLVASATTNNPATQQPLEVLSWNADETDYTLAIRHVSGPTDVQLKYVLYGPQGTAIVEHATHSATVVGHPAAAAAVAVGAVPHDAPDTIEPFSSVGDTTIHFDAAGNRLAAPEVRHKPDLVAVDGVTTTVPGFEAFTGTSAAAPHVAAIAAQMLSVNPHLTRAELYGVLAATAVDLGDAGVDPVFGHGLADALAAQSAAAATPDTTGPRVAAISPEGTVGWRPRHVAIRFLEPLDAATAGAAGSYDLREAGPDEAFGTGDDVACTLLCAYDDASRTVALTFDSAAAELPFGRYRLTLAGSGGIADPTGNPLNGGADEVREFTVSPEPPQVELPGSADGVARTIAPDGRSFAARAANIFAGESDWPQILIDAYDANGLPAGPALSIPANPTASFEAMAPDIAMDARGGAAVWADWIEVWYGLPDTYAIDLQYLDADGRPVGDFITIEYADAQHSELQQPQVALCDDRVVVVYEDVRTTGWVYSLHAAVFDRQGGVVREPFVIYEGTDRCAESARVAMDAAGNFVVTWDAIPIDTPIRARRFDRDGLPRGDVFEVSSEYAGRREGPEVAMTPDGRTVFAWTEGHHGYGEWRGTWFRIYDDAGQPLCQPQCVAPKYANEPAVGIADDGRFVIAWKGNDTDGWGVYARRYGPDGTPAGEVIRLSDDDAGEQRQPRVVMAADGRFLATWTGAGADPNFARWCEWDSSLPAAAFGPSVQHLDAATTPAGPLTVVTVAFDRAIDPATFGLADVTLKSPAGEALALAAADPITDTGDGRTFQLHLAEPQSQAGLYRLTVGPHVADPAGREMNGDGDMTNGEAADAYSGTLPISHASVATDLPFEAGFEGGDLSALGGHWSFETVADGLITVTAVGGPHGGGYHLVTDHRGNWKSQERATLHLDLAGQTGVTLDFWVKYISGRAARPSLQISADGDAWHQVLDLNPLHNGYRYPRDEYRRHAIDLDAAIADAGIAYTQDFRIAFVDGSRSYDYGPFAWDDIRVMAGGQDVFGPKVVGMAVPTGLAGPADCIDLTFDEPISAESFGADDVQVTAPDGRPVALRAAGPVTDTGDHRTFRVHFAEPQPAALGAYQVAVGPDVCDASVWHNAMNQDGDTIVGGLWDVYETSFSLLLAGDANRDGKVDNDDLAILEANFGAVGATWQQGDFNADASVDFLDYLAAKAHAGQSILPEAPAAEPTGEHAPAEAPLTVETPPQSSPAGPADDDAPAPLADPIPAAVEASRPVAPAIPRAAARPKPLDDAPGRLPNRAARLDPAPAPAEPAASAPRVDCMAACAVWSSRRPAAPPLPLSAPPLSSAADALRPASLLRVLAGITLQAPAAWDRLHATRPAERWAPPEPPADARRSDWRPPVRIDLAHEVPGRLGDVFDVPFGPLP